jgi:large subunit ribosomal protein L18
MKTIRKRRKQSKTDYLKRIKLLKSRKPRLVFRKTNKYIIAQYIISKEARDSVKIGINSKILLKYGWPKEKVGSLKSLSASYLIGYLMGKRILKDKLEEPIIDFGMIRTIHKTKVFAFLKGLVDSGLNIKYKEETFPKEERIMKKDININEIKSKIDNNEPLEKVPKR